MLKKKIGCSSYGNIQLVWNFDIGSISLALAYSEHLCPAYGTDTLGCRLTILHGYWLGVFHFPFGAAFDTIGLHSVHLLNLLGKFVKRR